LALPPAENVESVGRFFDRILNAGDMASLETFAHRDVLVAESAPGIEGLRRLLVEMRNTFANPEYKVIETVSEGEKVVVRFSARATHAGRFMGIPATGRKLKLWGVMMFHFEADAIAEFWSLVEAQGILKQLREP
jgi:steroid delta-isomerase-like uncharacterized protein